MTTYVFAWNPKLWNWPQMPRDRKSIDRRGHVDIEWACGRTRNIEPGFDGVYFCGGTTHPGAGIPLAALSGKLVANAILKA